MDDFRVDLVHNCDPYSGGDERGSKKRPRHAPEPSTADTDEIVLSSDGQAEDAPSTTYGPPKPGRQG
jgi:hypothetical protein